MMEKGKRNTNLDAMRVLACMAVVGLHTISNKRSAVEMCFYLVCGFAVPVFFMASGYTLLSRERVGYGYVARKAGQLLGIAVGWHVLFWLLELTADALRGDFSLRWMTALPGEFFDSFFNRGWFSHFWYLWAAALVYACLPLLIRLRARLWHLFVALLCVGGALTLASCLMGEPLQRYCTQTLRLWIWLKYFILGGLLAGASPSPLLRLKRLSLRWHTALLAVLTLALIPCQYLLARDVLHMPWAEHFYDGVFETLWITVLFTWVMKLPIPAKAAPCVRRLSSLTLGVYITHGLLLKVITGFPVAHAPIFACAALRFLTILLLSALATWILSRIPVLRRLV